MQPWQQRQRPERSASSITADTTEIHQEVLRTRAAAAKPSQSASAPGTKEKADDQRLTLGDSINHLQTLCHLAGDAAPRPGAANFSVCFHPARRMTQNRFGLPSAFDWADSLSATQHHATQRKVALPLPALPTRRDFRGHVPPARPLCSAPRGTLAYFPVGKVCFCDE